MGLTVQLGYKNTSGYKNVSWIQNISENSNGVRSIYNDPSSHDDDLPFYWTNKELANYTNVCGFNLVFNDSPYRPLYSINDNWSATLSLAGVLGYTYFPLFNINYGFTINNGQLSIGPVTISPPVNQSIPFNPNFKTIFPGN